MLSEKCINDIAKELSEKIVSAEVVIDEEKYDADILRKENDKNLIKIFININAKNGNITDIRLKDKDNNILISKPQSVVKTAGYALVSSFYVQIVEDEIVDPVSVFELAKAKEDKEDE